MTEPDFATAAIVGLGLMGGSMALALQQAQPRTRVIGIDSNLAARSEALDRGIDARGDLGSIAQADVVVLATPVRTILEQLPLVAEHAKKGALILDIGSTKRQIVSKMETLPDRVQPIGGHPMCGKESAGITSADPSLYRGAPFVLSPLARTSAVTLERARSFVRRLGAQPIVLTTDRHDRVVALVSHLPFAVASTLMNITMNSAQSDDEVLGLAASGFRDSTRLAASDTRMMLDTLLTNRDNVADLLRAFGRELDMLADAVESGDDHAVALALDRAARQRREMFK